MRSTSAILLRNQLVVRCACGEPATRFKTTFLPNNPTVSGIVRPSFALPPAAFVNTAVDGSCSVTEYGCDAHSEKPGDVHSSGSPSWRDLVFAEAVRELNTEAGR